jgi:hypothetical protein
MWSWRRSGSRGSRILQGNFNDKAALSIRRLDKFLDNAMGYITQLRGAMGRIDKELRPEESV